MQFFLPVITTMLSPLLLLEPFLLLIGVDVTTDTLIPESCFSEFFSSFAVSSRPCSIIALFALTCNSSEKLSRESFLDDPTLRLLAGFSVFVTPDCVLISSVELALTLFFSDRYVDAKDVCLSVSIEPSLIFFAESIDSRFSNTAFNFSPTDFRFSSKLR